MLFWETAYHGLEKTFSIIILVLVGEHHHGNDILRPDEVQISLAGISKILKWQHYSYAIFMKFIPESTNECFSVYSESCIIITISSFRPFATP